MKLFVGLGNPGDKYAGHRHNVGFMAVERFAQRHQLGPWKRRFQGVTSDGEIAGERVVLLKPDTYMNESGRAVGEAARFLKIALVDIVVFHDELDLAPGKLKVKTGGGNAGHNGLRSITQHLGNEFARVRIGIGHPGAKELVQSWVLHDFARADRVWLDPLLAAMADAAGRLATGNLERFLTDVARLTGTQDDPQKDKQDMSTSKPDKDRSGAGAERRVDDNTPGRPGLANPLGDRAAKRKGALADNLAKWMKLRKPPAQD